MKWMTRCNTFSHWPLKKASQAKEGAPHPCMSKSTVSGTKGNHLSELEGLGCEQRELKSNIPYPMLPPNPHRIVLLPSSIICCTQVSNLALISNLLSRKTNLVRWWLPQMMNKSLTSRRHPPLSKCPAQFYWTIRAKRNGKRVACCRTPMAQGRRAIIPLHRWGPR